MLFVWYIFRYRLAGKPCVGVEVGCEAKSTLQPPMEVHYIMVNLLGASETFKPLFQKDITTYNGPFLI